jgi:hypothetical protein
MYWRIGLLDLNNDGIDTVVLDKMGVALVRWDGILRSVAHDTQLRRLDVPGCGLYRSTKINVRMATLTTSIILASAYF